MQKISIFIFFLALTILGYACTRDVAPEISCEGVATYDLNIRMIIETNCSYPQCHDGSISQGVYLNFEGLQTDIDNGKFENEVITSSTMPPPYASGPTELTQEELDLIICWIAEGYPEN